MEHWRNTPAYTQGMATLHAVEDVSRATGRNKTTKILTIYISSPFAVVGLLVNVMCLVAMCRERRIPYITRLNNIILSIVNINLLVLSPLMWQLFYGQLQGSVDISPIFLLFHYATFYLLRINMLVRSWLLVLISLERLLSLRTRRLQLRSFWTQGRVCLSITLMCVSAAVIQFPFLSYHMLLLSWGFQGRTTKLNGIICGVLDLMFKSVGPVLVHILIWSRIRAKISRHRSSISERSSRKVNRVVTGLHLSTAATLVFLLPPAIFEALTIPAKLTGWSGSGAYEVAAAVGAADEVSSVFLSLVHFLVYFYLSSSFRKAIRSLFFWHNKKNTASKPLMLIKR